jgi:SNF2 family DNA or RNA helicase
MQLPSNYSSFQKDAEESIKQNLVKDIEFSGSTYQILVEDLHTHEEYWVFLQLEGNEKIRDAFCSCEDGHNLNGCLHLAVACLSIFNGQEHSLSYRFNRSLWNQLCHLYEERLGSNVDNLICFQPGHYAKQSVAEKIIFTLKALDPNTKNVLENILHQRPRETEETSLKFSNLSSEEIVLWREGRPPSQLRYDLSFWSDLAKWLMKMQEEKVPYTISFEYSKKNLPNWIQINFQGVEIGFYLSEANLPLIIPALSYVQSPLKIHDRYGQGISSITYDKKNGVLNIASKSSSASQSEIGNLVKKGGIAIEGWTFVPYIGFYAEEPHELLLHPYLEGQELSEALTEHSNLIGNFLSDVNIHPHSMTISYLLSFDSKWNLHIKSYLFEPGDLSQGDSRLIGDWAYLDNDGFYHLEEKRFDEVDFIIPISKISDFVTQNRTWLNQQEGFQTHIKSLEYQISYQLSENRRLTFYRTLSKNEEDLQLHDFGSWVYLHGHGFYSKKGTSFHFLFKSGFSLSPEQIPIFIKMNRDELELIPNFFNLNCPLITLALKVELTGNATIKVTPQSEPDPILENKKIDFFDEFVYVEGMGFYELPALMRLPEKYRNPIELIGEEADQFIESEIDDLSEYISELDTRLMPPKKLQLVANFIEAASEKGKGWYYLQLFYQTENGLISVIDLFKHINKRKKGKYAFFKEGRIDLSDNRFDWLRLLNKDRIDKSSNKILLTTLEFMRLNAFDSLQILQKSPESTVKLFNELVQLKTPEEPDVGGLVSHLRPYQELGVQWLWFLYSQRLSGLLCDDMGLGKTHQAMALLASVVNFFHKYAEGHVFHFLIVCPTSVIYHWQEKLEKFLPGKRVCTFYGSNRSLEEFHLNYDILLTSYGILRNEKETLSKMQFEIAIFDEIQVAKNQSSQVYQSLVNLKATMKLGLTGTPIENHLRELKSLFDIVLPTYMPSESNYREFFIKPIEKGHDPMRKALLHRLITPFTLRRKKEDVLKDLPEKIEEVAYCDLVHDQQKLYSDVLEQRRRHLVEELKSESTPIPYMHIFALLSSLKQICDHPAVFHKTPHDYGLYHSGKWLLFKELLREARESQQKVVVFSQYLGMLDIIQHYLAEEHIGFASLRGSTSDRKEQIYTFQNDPECEVFVGSLQAAGLGIDLTAGSVVIHYDRWWNAARENQATDRVYRIGQKRGVQVFKLVTKGTFEEKIDAMILRKGQLMEDVVGVDDQNTLKRFSRDELLSLLELTETGEHMKLQDED